MAIGGQRSVHEVSLELIARGELYQPTKTFIERLGMSMLSQKRMEDLVCQMCDVARQKMKRDKGLTKKMQGWLQEAANSMDVLQLASPQWIDRQVHKIIIPPRKTHQSAESTASFRDVRLKTDPNLERRVE